VTGPWQRYKWVERRPKGSRGLDR